MEVTKKMMSRIRGLKKALELMDRPIPWSNNTVLTIEKEDAQAIETILLAYEKEYTTSHYLQSELDQSNAKLLEEKEKNKELEKRLEEIELQILEDENY